MVSQESYPKSISSSPYPSDFLSGGFLQNGTYCEDGLLWYAYCSNNPLKFIDPTGLRDEPGSQVSDYNPGNQEELDKLTEAQKEARENPEFQPGSGGPFHNKYDWIDTWCNMSTYYVTEEVDPPAMESMLQGGEPAGNTTANEAGRSLDNTQATPSSNYGEMKELTPEQAQKEANKGNLVIASNIKPEDHGHLSTVYPDFEPYDSNKGPTISNIGINVGIMPAIIGFNGIIPRFYIRVEE